MKRGDAERSTESWRFSRRALLCAVGAFAIVGANQGAVQAARSKPECALDLRAEA